MRRSNPDLVVNQGVRILQLSLAAKLVHSPYFLQWFSLAGSGAGPVRRVRVGVWEKTRLAGPGDLHPTQLMVPGHPPFPSSHLLRTPGCLCGLGTWRTQGSLLYLALLHLPFFFRFDVLV